LKISSWVVRLIGIGIFVVLLVRTDLSGVADIINAGEPVVSRSSYAFDSTSDPYQVDTMAIPPQNTGDKLPFTACDYSIFRRHVSGIAHTGKSWRTGESFLSGC